MAERLNKPLSVERLDQEIQRVDVALGEVKIGGPRWSVLHAYRTGLTVAAGHTTLEGWQTFVTKVRRPGRKTPGYTIAFKVDETNPIKGTRMGGLLR